MKLAAALLFVTALVVTGSWAAPNLVQTPLAPSMQHPPQLMWLNVFLLVVYQGDDANFYWRLVYNERAIGCHIYDFIWESCPINPPYIPSYALYPIPATAIETLSPEQADPRPKLRP
jgi:hypothetical protein